MCDWMCFFLFLSPFSYGFNFSQLDSGVIGPAIGQMITKAVLVSHGIPRYSIPMHQRMHKNVLLLQEWLWDLQAHQGCCLVSF